MPVKRNPTRKANYITRKRLERLGQKPSSLTPPDQPDVQSPDTPSLVQNRALSVRQPYAEQIMRGTKKIEYRSVMTHIRGRVYLYASLTPALHAYTIMGREPGDFTTGMIVGTVEIVDCTGDDGEYEWHLARPERLAKPIKPEGHPQPAWFKPFKDKIT